MACRVIRNSEGTIEQVLNNDGNPDPLFTEKLKDIESKLNPDANNLAILKSLIDKTGDVPIRIPKNKNNLIDILKKNQGIDEKEASYLSSIIEKYPELSNTDVPTILSREIQDLFFDNISANTENQIDKAFENSIFNFLKEYNIDVQYNQDIDAISALDLFNKSILLSKEGKLSDISLQASNFYIEVLQGNNEELYKQLSSSLYGWSKYNEIKEQISSVYPNKKDLHKAMMGYYLNDQLVNNKKDNLFERIIEFIIDFFSNKNVIPGEILYAKEANKILQGDFSSLSSDYGSDFKRVSYEKTFEQRPDVLELVEQLDELGAKLTGSLVLRKVGNVLRKEEGDVHDLDFILTSDDLGQVKDFLLAKGGHLLPSFSIPFNETTNHPMIISTKEIAERFMNLKGDYQSRLDVLESEGVDVKNDVLLIDLFEVKNKLDVPMYINIFQAKRQFDWREKDMFDLLNFQLNNPKNAFQYINYKNIIEQRGRNPYDPKELALVEYAEELVTQTPSTVTGNRYGDFMVFKESPHAEAYQLAKIGEEFAAQGLEFVVEGNFDHPGWKELWERGFAERDMIANEWTYLPQELTQEEDTFDTDLDKAMLTFFKDAGFSLRTVRSLGDSNALVDPMKMIVQVAEGKRNAYTLPEEAAHIAISMLNDNELSSLLRDIVNRPEYQEVKDDYNYTDENQIRREAIAKVVSKVLVEGEQPQVSHNIFRRLIEAIAKRLSSFLGNFNKNVASYSSIADMVRNSDIRDIQDKRTYFQKSTVSQIDIVSKLDAQSDMFLEEKDGNRYKVKIDGKVRVVKRRVSDFVNIAREKIFGNFASNVDKAELQKAADAGTVIHMYQELLMNHVVNNIPFTQASIESEVISNLKTQDTMSGRPDAFFRILSEDFMELAEMSKALVDRVNARGEGAIFKFEQRIYNEATNEAGTIDLLVIHKDGSVSIYDYKLKFSQSFDNTRDPDAPFRLSANDRVLYNAQIGRYKSHLRDLFGVTHFNETAIVPIPGFWQGEQLRLATPRFENLDKAIKGIATLEPVARQGISHFSESFNNRLLQFEKQRDKLAGQLRKDPTNTILKERYYTLNEAILNLQVFNNPQDMIEIFQSTVAQAVSNMQSDEANIDNWVMAYRSLLEFEDMDVIMRPVIEYYANEVGLSAEEQKEMLDQLTEIASNARLVSNGLVDMFVQYHSENGSVDFFDPYKSKTGLSWMFDGLDEDASPTHRRLREMLGGVFFAARKEYERTKAEMDELWSAAKSQIGSVDDLIGDDGNLITKISRKLWEDRKELSGNALAEFNQKHFIFNAEAYAIKRQKEERKLFGDPAIVEKLDEFDKKHNPNKYESAWGTSSYLKVDYDNISEKYMSDNWKKIKDKEAVVAYLNRYSDFMYKFGMQSGKKFKGNFIPEISREGLERLISTGLVGNLRSVQQAMEIREVDIEFGTGDEYNIPFYFRDQLIVRLSESEKDAIRATVESEMAGSEVKDIELEVNERIAKEERSRGLQIKTRDIHKAFLTFAETTIQSIHKQEVENAVVSLKYILSERANEQTTTREGDTYIDQVTNTVMEKMGISNATADRFDALLNLHLYGRNTQGYDFKVGRYSGTKLLRAVMKYQGLKSVAFNPLIATANAINGFFSAAAFMKEGTYFNKDQFIKASNMWWKRDPKAMAALHYYHLSADKESRIKSSDTRIERDRQSINKALRAFSGGNIYAMHRIPNETLSRVVFLSIMQNYYVDGNNVRRIKDGETSILDTMKIEGENLETGFSDLIEGKIHTLHSKIMNRITGEVSWEQRSKISTTLLGQVLMHFRNWLPGMTKARFQDIKYDDITDTAEVGRLRVFVEEATISWENAARSVAAIVMGNRMIKALPKEKLQEKVNKINKLNPKANLTVDDYLKLREGKLKSALFELRVIGAVLAIANLAAALGWDDEDAGWFSSFAYRAINRLNLELSFFVNPVSAVEILKQPFVMLREIDTVTKILGNGFFETLDTVGIIDQSKNDTTGYFYYTSQAVPILNVLLRFANYYDSRQEKEFIEYFMK